MLGNQRGQILHQAYDFRVYQGNTQKLRITVHKTAYFYVELRVAYHLPYKFPGQVPRADNQNADTGYARPNVDAKQGVPQRQENRAEQKRGKEYAASGHEIGEVVENNRK